MPLVRDDEQVARKSVPGVVPGQHAYPALEHVDRRLARVLVLVQPLPGHERDDRLPQRAVVAAVYGLGAPATVAAVGDLQLFATGGGQRQLLHAVIVASVWRP